LQFVKRTELGAEVVDIHSEVVVTPTGQPRKLCLLVTTVKGQTCQFLGGPDYNAIFEK
jgi:hypothetical protein